MENLLLAASVVSPLLIMMLTGVLLRRFHVLEAETAVKLNRIVFYIGVPALCFMTIMGSDFSHLEGASALLLYVGGMTGAFLLLLFLVPRFCSSNPRRGSLVQGMFRPNEAIFGIPIATALYGNANFALLSIAIVLSVLLNNLYGVLALELFHDKKQSVGRMLLELAKNPILIACAAAIVLRLCGLELPAVLASPLRSFANMCAPLAFLALGASLSLRSLAENRRALTVTALVKLIVLPGVMTALAVLLGFRGVPVATAIALFATPTAVSSFALATNLGGDGRLSGEIVAVTSVLSMPTIFLFIFILKQLGAI